MCFPPFLSDEAKKSDQKLTTAFAKAKKHAVDMQRLNKKNRILANEMKDKDKEMGKAAVSLQYDVSCASRFVCFADVRRCFSCFLHTGRTSRQQEEVQGGDRRVEEREERCAGRSYCALCEAGKKQEVEHEDQGKAKGRLYPGFSAHEGVLCLLKSTVFDCFVYAVVGFV